MSPERTEYYRAKQRKMAFYIVENDKYNGEENPPTVSAIMGLDRELELVYSLGKRPEVRINREINSSKKEKDTVKKSPAKRNSIHCPSLPTQWRNNLDIVIPKAQFGHFSPTRI